MVEKTVCYLLRDHPVPEVLLGYKKVRFGAGKYTGIGGGVEAGESVAAAAVRELAEELSVQVDPGALVPAGRITFVFPAKPEWSQVAHIFVVREWHGRPVESEEVIPAWFAVDAIPYNQMWQDAAHWLPRVLAGKIIQDTYTFSGDNETVAEVELGELPD